jgi:hypothetical protein
MHGTKIHHGWVGLVAESAKLTQYSKINQCDPPYRHAKGTSELHTDWWRKGTWWNPFMTGILSKVGTEGVSYSSQIAPANSSASFPPGGERLNASPRSGRSKKAHDTTPIGAVRRQGPQRTQRWKGRRWYSFPCGKPQGICKSPSTNACVQQGGRT